MSEYFYPGTKYSLEPEYGNAFGNQVYTISMSTDPRTANQIQEVSNKLNAGIKNIEVEGLSPEIFEAVPEQHLTEINRLTKLTGVTPSIHGPLVEASGYTREGWSEQARQASERQMMLAVERSHEINPDGNIPITFHSTAMLPEAEEKVIIEEEGVKKEVIKAALVVDPETGKIYPIRERKKYFPGQPKVFDVKTELKEQNEEIWRNMLTHVAFNVSRGSDYLEMAWPTLKGYYEKIQEGKLKYEELDQAVKTSLDEFKTADIFLRDGYRELKELYNKAYEAGDEKAKKKLTEYSEKISVEEIEKNPAKLSEVIKEGLRVLDDIGIPQTLKPLNDFILEKSSDTFANTAFKGYDKFGSTAPIVSIENPPAGAGLSRAEDLRKLIEMSREKFVEKAKKEGYSESEAKKAAEKVIGATWDVGHINMLRKYGYEKKELLEQAGKIAPFVKHVHLSDNFGFEHTELPMGMGNVPFKEILAKLGKEGFKGKKVIEAAQWFQHFKTPPLPETLEAMGSPLYPMIAQPTWTQVYGTQGIYSSGYGLMLPEQHFSIYGAGFTSLPSELGGQVSGKQSRLSGTPNA